MCTETLTQLVLVTCNFLSKGVIQKKGLRANQMKNSLNLQQAYMNFTYTTRLDSHRQVMELRSW